MARDHMRVMVYFTFFVVHSCISTFTVILYWGALGKSVLLGKLKTIFIVARFITFIRSTVY